MQTYTAKLRRELEDAGFRFVKGDLWECQTGDEDAPETLNSNRSLSDLINDTAKALGGC